MYATTCMHARVHVVVVLAYLVMLLNISPVLGDALIAIDCRSSLDIGPLLKFEEH